MRLITWSTIAILLVLWLWANNSDAYDKTILDKYGRTVGYIKVKDNGDQELVDKYGRTGDIIKEDGRILDKYGKTTGYIKEKK